MVYQWKPGSRVKLKAQVVGTRLESLRKKHGKLTPAIVVADAKADTSPLHPAFEWDDKKAAAEYREVQAGYIIRSVEIVVSEEGQEDRIVRAFANIIEDDDQFFTSMTVALADPTSREYVLREAKEYFEDGRKRYKHLQEFAAVFAAMDNVAV